MCSEEQQEGKKLSVVEGLGKVVELAANFQKFRRKVVLTQGRRTQIVFLIVRKEKKIIILERCFVGWSDTDQKIQTMSPCRVRPTR